jgi:beta-glucosidase
MHHQAVVAALAAAAMSPLAQAATTKEARQESPWDAAYGKAQSALARLSLSDKVGIVTGSGWQTGPCVGNSYNVPTINYRPLCLQDGPLGVRYASDITAFTPGVQAASTWDRELIRQRSQFIAEEAKTIGVNVMLGPVGGALGKHPDGGRNWEGFSPDPYLTGVAMAESIEAMQAQGVQANAKHYLLNEQELNRNSMSSNADDRTIHELYLWPYADAVHANVASVMCSYNRLNGTFACENDRLLNGLLKEELGFPGYVLTDWGAHHSTVQSALTGLDFSTPGTDYNGGEIYWGPALTSAVNNGQIPQSRVDDMVTRILAGWYLTGQDQGFPQVNLNANAQGNHKTNVRAIAADGIVLLKNEDNILPLGQGGSIAVIGSGAVPGRHARNECSDKGCNDGALGMGWGSGTVEYPYFSAPSEAIQAKASSVGATVTLSGNDNAGQGASAASGKDVALVFITADAGEGYITVENNAGDRNNLNPWHNGNELVEAVAAASDNVIVVVHSVGPIILERIRALPSVKAIVWAGLGSQETGNALVDVLWGDVNPNGKLVYTIAKQQSDYGIRISSGDDNYPEGLYIDYRHFDKQNIEPAYEFGFGLSYTTFDYSAISVDSTATAGPASGPIIPGGNADLWDTVATVTATITNSGDVDGAEVAQLYITLPSASSPDLPPQQLRGFEKLRLAAGESGTATFNLRRRDLSYWDVAAQKWVVPSGEFQVVVGASSRDARVEASFTV